MECLTIDTHQHFWKYNPIKDQWIDESMEIIRRDFMPHDLQPLLYSLNIGGCVAVQADTSIHETDFLLDLAKQHDFIKAVVGWIDFKQIHPLLERWSGEKKLKGFRDILQGQPPEYLQSDLFLSGIKVLGTYGYTYDILVYPHHLKAVYSVVSQYSNQKFVIDHLAKPYIKDQKIEDWKKDLKSISVFPNVYCKVSGMITEASWDQWKINDLRPYFEVALELFGPDRLMFGSDWPVCQLAGGYEAWWNTFQQLIEPISPTEQQKIRVLNAQQFYDI
jgi:L-fuconolactonase